MDSGELRKVAGGITEWGRRVRELRNEEGFQILTHNDRSDMKPGQYLLLEAKPKPAFQRDVSKELRSEVLDRNGYTCQMCGAVAGEPTLMIRAERPGCTSATSSTNHLVGQMILQTSEPFVQFAMKVRQI